MGRERRKDKLMVMGIPEPGQDGSGSSVVREVIKSLIPESDVGYVVIGRIGKRIGNAVRPLRIKFESLIDRQRLLARNKELRNKEGMDRIYIVPDMTKVQQEKDKKLREEVKTLRNSGEAGVKISRGEVLRGATGGVPPGSVI